MDIRILLVDDHAGVRALIRRMLEASGMRVVGEAVDAASALTEARRLRPDLVLMDVMLPGADGIDAAAAIGRDPVAPPVVLTSSREAADFGARLEEAPVLGFVPKRELSGGALAALWRGRG